MKVDQEKIITAITTLIGIATMLFGLSQQTANVLTNAVAPIVGGVMATVTVVTYLINLHKKKTTVFDAMAYRQGVIDPNGTPRQPAEIDKENERILNVAKASGMR
jgi:hypothetical protein